MSTSRTTTITQPTASTSSRPANPPSPGAPVDDEEDVIMREALARVERVKDARNQATQAQEQEDGVVERRRKLAVAATARSQGGTSTGEASVSPRRPVVEIPRVKGKGKARAQPVGEDPDDGDNGDDNDDDEEDREPCE
ncbi:hypothetical protein LENED_012070 [Lentinula edodes]|uniref:Uncharacterized protein n=1 Tax=Lentinula edodes TaxID=5353 RepID=A0A1Q3ERX0_LENED|nr:hypothetical protein LENED_012070 [Lentinula edodes]